VAVLSSSTSCGRNRSGPRDGPSGKEFSRVEPDQFSVQNADRRRWIW
jgi:hypothetical protein